MGAQADWNAVDSLMLKALSAAEKVARYRHAQLSAVRLSGDLNARPENVNLEELLESIKAEWTKLGPLIGLDPNQLLLLQTRPNASGPGARQGHTPQPVGRLSAALEVVGAWPR